MKEKNHRGIDISVIIPIYNEEKVIPELYERLRGAVTKISENYEFIFINDGSRDGSLNELTRLSKKDPGVYYIHLSRNFGHQVAVSAGIDTCRGSAVVIIDGDLQDPPELIPDLYKKYSEGYEVVYARRKSRKGEGFFKKFSARQFYRILQRVTSVDIPVDTGDFRIIDRKVVEYLRQMPEQNKFLRGQIAWLGFNQAEVLFTREQRKHGKSGYSFGKMLRFALDGITGFSDTPLRLVTKIGFSISFISFVIILYAVYSHFILERTITGWTSLIISSMFIGGVQLISIGVIGEYISRINRNVLNRPLYIVENSNISSQNTPDGFPKE